MAILLYFLLGLPHIATLPSFHSLLFIDTPRLPAMPLGIAAQDGWVDFPELGRRAQLPLDQVPIGHPNR